MEVRILDSIMHGVLKPWKMDVPNTRRIKELVQAAKSVSPQTYAELIAQLNSLLADYPTLQKVLSDEVNTNTPLQQLLCDIDLPMYKDGITHLYFLLITGETLRFFNSVMQQAENWKELVDIRYRVGKTLDNIRVLAQQVSIELKELGLASTPNEQSSCSHFALYYLKHSLIQLYFSIQKTFESSLKQVTTLEDFYLLELEEPISNIVDLEFRELPNINGKEQYSKLKVKRKISFGFTGDKDRLKIVIEQLCQKIELLNEDQTSKDNLWRVFTTNDIGATKVKIQIGCETAQFRYIVDKLTPHFTNLKLKTIEKTEVFFSKNGTKITAQNLSAGKVDIPKEKDTIDKIFKQMQ